MHLVLFKYMLRYAIKIYDELSAIPLPRPLHFPNYHQANNFKKQIE